jgi:phosphatidylglycerophosphatase A
MVNRTLTRVVATFFGIGFIPFVPATWASAVAALLAWFIPGSLLVYCFLALSVAGLCVCRPSQDVFGSSDPKPFVLDEVCGMMLSVLWLPKTLPLYVTGFILFRLFDVWKPGPIRMIQNHRHPTSILWDDLAAGLFANGLLRVLIAVLR